MRQKKGDHHVPLPLAHLNSDLRSDGKLLSPEEKNKEDDDDFCDLPAFSLSLSLKSKLGSNI
ncbi:hypothetical protein NC652_037148 [Populus alba x Populus x berolinensis]|nr:hypothetical protein NC652_037148 [Populus alba x Populus x berolinensis]